MLILAVEMSSAEGSAALLRDRQLLASRVWREERGSGAGLFAVLRLVLAGAGAEIADVDVFAAGLGPGSYAGLRMAVAALRAMAMPRNKPVYGVSSAAVIAFRVMREQNAQKALVTGDARRGMLWARLFESRAGIPEPAGPWQLAACGDAAFPFASPAGAVVASPDWYKIGARLQANVKPPAFPILAPALPGAAQLAELTRMRMDKELPSEPFEPVYLTASVPKSADSGKAH